MSEIRDARAIGHPDIPYSAYCKVCWQNIYHLWIDAEPPPGTCPFGAEKIVECSQAKGWEESMGRIRSYLRASKEPPHEAP